MSDDMWPGGLRVKRLTRVTCYIETTEQVAEPKGYKTIDQKRNAYRDNMSTV